MAGGVLSRWARIALMMMLLLAPVARRIPGVILFGPVLILLALCNSATPLVSSLWMLLPWFVSGMALLGLVPAALAYRQGRSFFRWWIYGTVQFSGALSKAVRLQTLENPDGTLRKCPKCHRWIQGETMVCGYCGNEVNPLSKDVIAAQKRVAKEMIRLADRLPRWLDD